LTTNYLVVVVVVVCMTDTILSETVVLKRRESAHNENNVATNLRFSELHDHYGETVAVEVAKAKAGGFESFLNYETDVYSSEPGITLPTHIVDDYDMYPGEKYRFKVTESKSDKAEKEEEFVDDITVIDRVEPKTDVNREDGISNSVWSKKTHDYLKDNDTVVYENLRTGDKAIVTPSRYSDRPEVSFVKEVRNKLNVEIDDTIEIRGQIDEEETESDEDKIDEIHDMVSELYDAYQNNND